MKLLMTVAIVLSGFASAGVVAADEAMSRGLLNLVTVRMISSWPSLVMQTLVAGS
jgi:hypothetical protein